VRIDAAVEWSRDGMLRLTYRLRGDLGAVRLPAAAAAGPADGLWHHTCFEAFLGRDGVASYHELNFAPSGAWAIYAFRGHRDRDPTGRSAPAPEIWVTHSASELTLVATALPARTFAPPDAASLQVGLTAVVEDAAGTLSYWALHHPADLPDFHHPGGRTLRLAAPDGACEAGTS